MGIHGDARRLCPPDSKRGWGGVCERRHELKSALKLSEKDLYHIKIMPGTHAEIRKGITRSNSLYEVAQEMTTAQLDDGTPAETRLRAMCYALVIEQYLEMKKEGLI